MEHVEGNTRYMCITRCAKRINFDSFRGEQGEVERNISCWAQCTTQSESGWKNFWCGAGSVSGYSQVQLETRPHQYS